MRTIAAVALLFCAICFKTVGFSNKNSGTSTNQEPAYPNGQDPLPTTLPQAKGALAKAEQLLAKAQAQALGSFAKHPSVQQGFNASQRDWTAYYKAELAYASMCLSQAKPAERELPLTNIKIMLIRQRTNLINGYFTIVSSTVTDVTPKPHKQ